MPDLSAHAHAGLFKIDVGTPTHSIDAISDSHTIPGYGARRPSRTKLWPASPATACQDFVSGSLQTGFRDRFDPAATAARKSPDTVLVGITTADCGRMTVWNPGSTQYLHT